MSELKVNKISANTDQKISVNSGLIVGSGTTGQFQVTGYGHVKLLGPLFFGTQNGGTFGNPNEVLTSSGIPNAAPTFSQFTPVCPSVGEIVPQNLIQKYFINGYYPGCSNNYSELPDPPTGFLYCDGTKGTPNFKTTPNPLTGQLWFEGNCNPSSPYTISYIIKT